MANLHLSVPHSSTIESQTPAKLSARDLAFYYGDFKAIKELSLDVPENKVTALIGPSGCGKSTLLRSINRMNDLVPGFRMDGEIAFEGTSVHARATDVIDLRRRVGMVFQKPNPFPKSIFENVAFGLRLLGETTNLHALVEESLRAAALWER
jgi:phosphate transport system ATP-binding protein